MNFQNLKSCIFYFDVNYVIEIFIEKLWTFYYPNVFKLMNWHFGFLGIFKLKTFQKWCLADMIERNIFSRPFEEDWLPESYVAWRVTWRFEMFARSHYLRTLYFYCNFTKKNKKKMKKIKD